MSEFFITFIVLAIPSFAVMGIAAEVIPVPKFKRGKHSPENDQQLPQVVNKHPELYEAVNLFNESLAFQRRLKEERKDYCVDMENLVEHFNELWGIIQDDGEVVVQETAIKYTDILTRIAQLTGEGYWGELALKSKYWKDDNTRRDQVEMAVKNVAEMTLENIYRHKENQAMEYEVDLQILNNHSTPMKITDGSESKPILDLEELLYSERKIVGKSPLLAMEV